MATFQFHRIGVLIGGALAVAAAIGAPMSASVAAEPQAQAVRQVPGPKRTIAVGQIEASGGFGAGENWDVGGALSAMLTEALTASGRFIVVERSALSEILNEKELQSNRLTGGGGGGKMIPAQYLVVGSVTEFGGASKGSGLSIGGLNLPGTGTGGAALNRQSGKIRVDLRVLDTRTGEVVDAFTVSRAASRTGVAVNATYRGVSSGANAFSRTPLGDASRGAMQDAVPHIAQALAARDWQGRVVEWDGVTLVINGGAEAGLAPGDRLRVERPGKVLTDPETGRVLSEARNTLGEVVISSTEPKVAQGRFSGASGYVPQRGDFVVYVSDRR
jgi:curli biogenesis system outer membrane secretion channel CsgG